MQLNHGAGGTTYLHAEHARRHYESILPTAVQVAINQQPPHVLLPERAAGLVDPACCPAADFL